jgi:hypothetical protein
LKLTIFQSNVSLKEAQDLYDELYTLKEDSSKRISVLEKLVETIHKNGKHGFFFQRKDDLNEQLSFIDSTLDPDNTKEKE